MCLKQDEQDYLAGFLSCFWKFDCLSLHCVQTVNT